MRKPSPTLLLVLALALAGCTPHADTGTGTHSSPSSSSPAVAAMVVTVEKPQHRIVPDSLSVTGTISARDELSIGAEVNGLRIVSIDVDEGSRVVAGQTLATLDGSVLEAQLRQARARVAEMRASLGKAIQPNRPQDIDGLEHGLYQARANREQAQDALKQAQATRRNAEGNLRRYTQLLNEDYATQQEYEDHVTEAEKDKDAERAAADQLRASEAAVQQSQDRLSLARAGGRREDVQYAHASTEEAEATVQQLEAQLAQTVILAPDSGLITRRDAHLGDITGSARPLFVMARKGELELRAQIPETDLAHVHVGQAVDLTAEATRARASGHVRLITPTIDATTRLGTARIVVPSGAGFMPGMFVHAQLSTGQTQTLVIPADAVLGSAEQPYVYLLQGSQAQRHPVTLGRRFKDAVEVKSGLDGTERVIVKGASFLADGDTVRVAANP